MLGEPPPWQMLPADQDGPPKPNIKKYRVSLVFCGAAAMEGFTWRSGRPSEMQRVSTALSHPHVVIIIAGDSE